MPEEQRFVLGIAYQAGPDPRIKRGVDGGRDWFSKAELERACWSYMRSGCPQMNAFHVDGTEDCAEPVESFIWRWPDWDVGDGIVVKDGDWCLGAILSPRMWDLHKAGKVNGLSPEGTARRLRVQKEGAVPLAKGSADVADDAVDDDDEFSELVDANVPKVALVGAAANGIPRFLISKQQGAAGLLDAEYVRGLIAKSEPTPQPQEAVTLTGSPAAVAELIRTVHGAPVRKAEPPAAEADEVEKADDAIVKAKYNADDLKRMAANGQAMKDESYPIADKEDLTRAVHAVGRGGASHDAIRAHIIRRAKALDASSEIPDNWGADGSLKKEADMAVVTGETDDGIDGMDPTVVLAEPDQEQPGDAMEPGSPAWEAVDAATARKWTAILVRAKNALGVMSDREMLEAATADPDDAEAAWDLQDAACAIDYVIDTLAGFAVGEQAEADLGGEAMDAVGKALGGFDTAALDTIESLTLVRKAGRVLSTANEAAIRGAVESLQKVLASLPAAPDTPQADAAVEKESAVSGTEQPPTDPDADTQGADGVEKAKGDPQLVVYDQKGKLLGIVDPGDLTPVANGDSDSGGEQGADAPADADATPPAGSAVATNDATLIPGTDTVASPPPAADDDEQVTKAVQAGFAPLLTEALAPIEKRIAEQDERNQVLADRLDAAAQLADVVKGLQERVEHLAKMPDDRKPPLLNGATGTAGMATRDGSGLAPYADLEKAVAEAGDPGQRRDAEQRLAYAKVRDRFIR